MCMRCTRPGKPECDALANCWISLVRILNLNPRPRTPNIDCRCSAFSGALVQVKGLPGLKIEPKLAPAQQYPEPPYHLTLVSVVCVIGIVSIVSVILIMMMMMTIIVLLVVIRFLISTVAITAAATTTTTTTTTATAATTTTTTTTTSTPPPPYQPPGASTHRHRHHQRKLYLQKMQGLRHPCL